MPVIMPIKDLRNTSEISDMAHKIQEPIFITKNGYSDLVVMSSELYDKFAKINPKKSWKKVAFLLILTKHSIN